MADSDTYVTGHAWYHPDIPSSASLYLYNVQYPTQISGGTRASGIWLGPYDLSTLSHAIHILRM